MNLFKSCIRAITILVCLLLVGVAAHAQYRAGVQGVVLDPQGAVVSGAKVTVTSNDTAQSQESTTDDKGVYTVNRLAPGLYTLTAEKTGFKKRIMDNVQVVAEQMNSVNVNLEVGAVAESVTVNADELPVIDTETGNLSGTFTTREVRALPVFGGDPFRMINLTLGVFGDGATGSGGGGVGMPGANQSSSGSLSSIFMTENQPQIVAGGTRNNGNSYQIDGVEVNSLAWGGSAIITPSKDTVKEVQVQANPYSAENGRNSGAQVLVVSQSGGNNFHGTAFFRMHRPGLDAYQGWGGPYGGAPQRDANRFNQYGGTLGGPIWKNRVFFFFGYDQLRNASTGTGSGWYVTPQFLASVPSSSPVANLFATFPKIGVMYSSINPVTCKQINLPPTQCQTIFNGSTYLGLDVGSPRTGATLGTLDPTYGQPCDPVTGLASPGFPCTPYGVGGGLKGTPDIFNVNTVLPSNQVATQWNGKMDIQITQKDLATFSVYWVPNNNTSVNGPAFGTNSPWNSNRLNYMMSAIWNHTFAPTLINELRFSASRWYFNEVRSNPQEPFGLPSDFFQAGYGFGGLASGPVFGVPGPGIFYQTTYNLRDTLTKVYGSHSLKFGADLYKEQDNDETPWAGVPNYNFYNLWDWTNDAPYLEGQPWSGNNFNPITGTPTSTVKYIRSNIYGFFAQDDWKAKPNLTFNFGLRWEYFGPIHEKYGNISTAVLGQGSNALTGLMVRTGGNQWNSSYNNWGPQIGFAWSPNGIGGHAFNNRLVIRGGAGIAYNRQQEAVTLNGRWNPPLVANETFNHGQMCGTPPNQYACILYAPANNVHNIFGFPSNPAAIQSFSSVTGLPTTGAVNLTAFDKNMPTPYVYRYSLLGQYDFGSHWVATLGYQGSQSRHFTRQINNLNWLYPNNLNSSVSGVDWYTNDANANYNAFLAQIQHQFAKNYQIAANYTYSKCHDHGSQDYFAYQYPFNQSASYGACDYDVSNSFLVSGTWQLHFFHGNDWKEKVLGGWQISGIYTYHTGFPFSPYWDVTVNWPEGSPNGGCSLVYVNSGYCNAIPAAYLGGAGSGTGNGTFKTAYGNFPNLATDPTAYFALPTGLSTSAIPSLPGIHRNIFRGPRYHDFDMNVQKAFGLPSMKFLGENAQFQIRADFYNLFNTLNLQPVSGPQGVGRLFLDGTTDQITSESTYNSFGRSNGALGSRVVEFTFRFQF